MKKEKSCGAVVMRTVDRQMQVLVIHQVQGHWGFPKGHVEEEETEEQTAVREIHEETGLKVSFEKGFRKTVQYSPYPGVIKEVVYFLAYPRGGAPKVQKDEVIEQEWVSLVQAMALLTYNTSADVLKDAVAFMKKKEPEGIDEWFTF
jgi:8-oxo-dGTP pyrophosphatase MutT (NUDIX family)